MQNKIHSLKIGPVGKAHHTGRAMGVEHQELHVRKVFHACADVCGRGYWADVTAAAHLVCEPFGSPIKLLVIKTKIICGCFHLLPLYCLNLSLHGAHYSVLRPCKPFTRNSCDKKISSVDFLEIGN